MRFMMIALAFVASLMLACNDGPAAPSPLTAEPGLAVDLAATTAPPPAAEGPTLTAEWGTAATVTLANHTDSHVWAQVVWESDPVTWNGSSEVKDVLIGPRLSLHVEPRCWLPGTTLVTVPGHGLWRRYTRYVPDGLTFPPPHPGAPSPWCRY